MWIGRGMRKGAEGEEECQRIEKSVREMSVRGINRGSEECQEGQKIVQRV